MTYDLPNYHGKPDNVQTTKPSNDAASRCVTHHFACDCRESLMAEAMQTHRRVIDWFSQSDEGLWLRCGGLTVQEIRTIRSVLESILAPNAPAIPTASDGRPQT